MSLTSFTFLFFILLLFIIYYIVPKRIQWLVLLVSSFYFLLNDFSWINLLYIGIILITSYIGAILIDKTSNTKWPKVILIVSILIILGVLFYLKYSNLLLVTINHILILFKVNYKFELVSRVSPLGISYFALIMVSYIIDTYRGINKPEKNIFKCALFMTYFPILTSGPFVRYNNTINNLCDKHKFNYDKFCKGLIRVIWGFFKVLVISQRLSVFVDTVFGAYNEYNGFYILIAAIFFTLQLYTNFSGSIDIIMGVSESLGIDLPENFNCPFFSKTITEFWRNWHITLGAWLKDYIFYPLQMSKFIQGLTVRTKKIFGKKAGKKIPLYLSMLIMWIIIGIWHGGAYTYILASGIFQFLFILFEDLLAPFSDKVTKLLRINKDTFSYKFYQIIRTFLLFSLSMVFFRANTVHEGIMIIKNMFKWNPWILINHSDLYTLGLDMYDFHILNLSIVVLLVVELLKVKNNVRDKLFEQNLLFRWGIIFILLFAVIIFGCYGPGYDTTRFIYKQF